MSGNASLDFPTSIDLAGLDRDLKIAEARVDDFASTAASRLGGLSVGPVRTDIGPSASGGGGGGGASAASHDTARLASAFAVSGGAIQKAIESAAAPLHSFASEFRTNFNDVGATVEKLSIRIDDAMRFPGFLARLEGFRGGVKKIFRLSGKDVVGEVGSAAASAQQAVQSATDSLNGTATKGKKRKANNPNQARNSAGQFAKAPPPLPPLETASLFPPALVAAAQAASAKINSAIGSVKKSIADLEAANIAKGSLAGGLTGLSHAFKQFGDVGKGGIRAVELAWMGLGGVLSKTVGFVASVEKLRYTISGFGSVAKATFKNISVGTLNAAAGGMKKLASTTEVASSAAKGLGWALTAGLGPIGLFFEAMSLGRAAFGWLAGGTKRASDLNETVSKTRITFGAASQGVDQFADEMAKKYGMVKGATLDTAASFGGLGKSIGRMSGQDLAKFSADFTRLSADLSSFGNIDAGQAGDAIRTALSGNQSDLLKQYGVITTEATVEQYALAHGIAKAGQELNEQQKFMARAGLITQGLARASGDLERTQGGAANQGRKLVGTVSNIGTTLGTVFLPVVTEGIVLLNEFGSYIVKAFEGSKSTVEGWTNTLLEGFDWVVATVHNFPAAFTVARLKIGEALTNIGEYFKVLGPNAVIVADYIQRNWLLLIGDAFEGTLTGLKNLWTNFQSIGKAIFEWFKNPGQEFKFNWTPLLDGFRATAEKFPELIKPALTDVSGQIAAAATPITDEVAKRRADRAKAKGLPAVAGLDAPVDPETGKSKKSKKKNPGEDKGETKFAGALQLGSKEAYSAIVSSQSRPSVSIEQSSKQTAANTAALVKILGGEKRPKRRPVQRLVIS